MSILPYEKYNLRTKLSQEEILKRMTVNTLYKGTGGGNEFKVQRVITYRNSFLPQIKGQITADSRGSDILITMRLHLFVIVFMCFWLAFVSLFCVLLVTVVDTSEAPNIFQAIPFIMIIFGVALLIVPFKIESKRSKKDLLSILEAEEIPMDKYK